MYIITVSPISRGAFTDQLTYWSPEAFNIGSIISVPFRSKHINALVQRCESASDAKMEIKSANFEPKKIEPQEEIKIINPQAIETAKWASHYYATHIGSILSLMIPNCALENIEEGKKNVGEKDKSANESSAKDTEKKLSRRTPIKIDTNESGLSPTPTAVLTSSVTPVSETLVVQGPTDDRKKTYKSIIREEFARQKSVIVIAPRIIDAENIFEELSKGIGNYCHLIHSGMSKKNITETWQIASETDHPIVYISTPGFALIPRDDISVIIIEQESSRVYSTGWPPFVDQRLLIEKYGKLIGARVILGDTLLRIETLYRREEGQISDLSQASFRLEKAPQTIVVDMNDMSHKDSKASLKIISEELWSMIDYAKKKNERVIIFCSRKGLSPQTVCSDCGKTVMCTRCSAPTVLHQPKSGDRYFLCHHCGEKRSALETCKYCNSWKLTTLGIGIDTIASQISDKRPDSKIFKLDRDSIKKEADGKKIVQDFVKKDHAILITTEIGLPFLPITPHIAIASLDSLFSLPDFKIGERIVHDLIELSGRAEKYFLIQTRNADSQLLRTMTGGGLLEFYRSEIEMREKLKYPPFMTFIKLTIQAPRDRAMKILEEVQEQLEEWEPAVFPAFTATVKNEAIINILLKLKNSYWEKSGENADSQKLRGILQNLPKEITVHVNPESML